MSPPFSLPSQFRRFLVTVAEAGIRSDGSVLRRRLVAFMVLMVTGPSLCLGPSLALETTVLLPAGASSVVSADLLPDKSDERVKVGRVMRDIEQRVPDRAIDHDLAAIVPFALPEAGDQSYLVLLETSGTLWGQPLMPQTWVQVYAVEDVPDDQLAPAPSEEIDEEIPLPDAEIGMDPPEEDGQGWAPDQVPAGPIDPDIPPDGVIREGPRNPTLVEQEVGVCVIRGEVSDATTLDPIVGAIVTVLGTGREDETDAQGRFEIGGLPSGDYAVEALKLGYSIGEASASPRPDSPAEVRLALRVKPTGADEGEFLLAEEVIVGEYTETNQGDFNLDLGASATLTSGLGAEDFAREGVSDAGEALAKVSGANVVDGKFAVVRGLADRYVSTTFNGGQISSAVADRKAVELDLFPTTAVGAIDVSKTHAPQLSGDFGGAAIDIRSKFLPEERVAEFKAKWKYDPDLPEDFRTVPGKGLGFLGELSNPLTPEAYSRVNPTTGQIRLITQPPSEARPVWQALDTSRPTLPTAADAGDQWSYGLTYGDRVQINEDWALGFLVAGKQESGDTYNESPQFRAAERSWDQQDFSSYVGWNLYAAAGLSFQDKHEVRLAYFNTHVAEQQVSLGSNIRDPNARVAYGSQGLADLTTTRPFYGADAEVLGGFSLLQDLERNLEIFQVSGDHKITDRGPKLRWGYTNSDAQELRPNTSFQEYTILDFQSPALQEALLEGQQSITAVAERLAGVPEGSITNYQDARQVFIDQGRERTLDRLEERNFPVVNESLGQIETLAVGAYVNAAGPGNRLTRAYQTIEESTTDGQVGIDLPFYFDEDNEDSGFQLSFGAGRVDKERQNRGYLYEFVYENLDASGESISGFEIDDLYPSNDANGNGWSDLGTILFGQSMGGFITGSPLTGPFYQDGSTGTDNFVGLIANNVDSRHDIESLYVSGDLFLGDFFFRGGVRFESEVRQAEFLEPKPIGQVDPAALSETVWLPSITTGTTLFDGRLTLLAAWSNTVARPTFYEWVPTRSFDLSTNLFRAGNPNLKNSDVMNYDLSAEYAFNEGRKLRLSFFHKSITDPIVEVRVPGVGDALTFINGESGSLSGFELEGDFGNFGPFSLRSNLTYIDASIDYQYDTGDAVTVNFPYQPNWIFNMNLGYENPDWDLGVNLVYNFTSEYATLLRTNPNFPDVILQPQQTLDLIIRKGFEMPQGGRLVVTAGIDNLIGTDKEYIYEGGQAGVDGVLRNRDDRDRLYYTEVKYEF